MPKIQIHKFSLCNIHRIRSQKSQRHITIIYYVFLIKIDFEVRTSVLT
jgi:hypothetical protein